MVNMKRHLKICTIVYLLACSPAVRLTIAAPLAVRSFQKDASGVTINSKSEVLRLDVCNDRTIHVTSSLKGKLPEKNEFVVIRQWKPASFQWRVEPSHFILRTARMGVRFHRATGSLTFVDAAGKMLLQEPPDGGRIMEAKTAGNQARTYRVQQTFLSPNGERLYGMAQCQDGVWNWRGIPIELRQLNT